MKYIFDSSFCDIYKITVLQNSDFYGTLFVNIYLLKNRFDDKMQNETFEVVFK